MCVLLHHLYYVFILDNFCWIMGSLVYPILLFDVLQIVTFHGRKVVSELFKLFKIVVNGPNFSTVSILHKFM